jgi:putative ABC transport system permease protein
VVAEVSSLPGVRSAALVNPLPFGPVDITIDGGFRIAGRPDPAPDQMPQSLRTRVSPGYFAAMGIPLRGREFTDRDGKNAPGVAIVSETLARRYFAGEDPLGKHLLLGRQRLDFEIVGVAGDVRHINLRAEVRPELYISMAAFPAQIAGLVVRGSGDAAALLPAIERRVWSVDSGMAANLAAPVDSLLYASMSPARIAAVLLGIFAVTTLLLGLAGIYGVLSYAISQRQREFGIRLALGAAPRDVLRMVLGEAFGLAIAGVAVGGAAALGFTHYLDSLLFGVRAADPATYLVAGLGVAIAALLAAYTPARRAMRVDPAGSLRSE